MKPIEQIDQELRSKIIEAVPEIVELKFGCRVRIEGRKEVLTINDAGRTDLFGDGFAFISVTDDGKLTTVRVEDTGEGKCELYGSTDFTEFEILGRPIRIDDVLRAIHKTYPNRHIVVNTEGSFSEYKVDGELALWALSGKVKWNLSQPLDNQSPELKRFLHSVIIKK